MFSETRCLTSEVQQQQIRTDEGNFQIIVPTFNEEETLEHVLLYAKEHDYLKHLVFVDDASTDSSPAILRRWAKNEGVRAISLTNNRKKEGAIRAALEILEQDSGLAPYTILLDSDSLITVKRNQETVLAQIVRAIEYMETKGLAAMAFRIDAICTTRNSVFEIGAFADYSGMQFDQWLVGMQQQLWVINGPGGIFNTCHLLQILRSIVPDFETGDLLISVELMKQGKPIEFYPNLVVLTFVPTTLRSYFNQRRRWERGTTKVLWNERLFYFGLFKRPSFLAVLTLVHLSLYIGFVIWLTMITPAALEGRDIGKMLLVTALVWYGISVLKGAWLKLKQPTFPLVKYCLCAVVNSALWTFVTTPARITGFLEALFQLLGLPKNVGAGFTVSQAGYSWLHISDQGSELVLEMPFSGNALPHESLRSKTTSS